MLNQTNRSNNMWVNNPESNNMVMTTNMLNSTSKQFSTGTV
jgi:hypothetical protein